MFAKVFASLWIGTLYGKSDAQLVFIYLLAHCDPQGYVRATPQAISGATGLPHENVVVALAFLEAPDPDSNSPDLDGKRLERSGPQSWRVVNYTTYRALQDGDSVRSQAKERMRRYRERLRAASPTVTDRNDPSHDVTLRQEEVEVDGEVEAEEKEEPTLRPSVPDDQGGDRVKREWKQAFQTHFWAVYPRKIKKILALRAWMKLLNPKRDYAFHENLLSDVCAGVEWCVEHEWAGREADKIPYPATFLNARQWEDAFDGTQEPHSESSSEVRN